MGVSLAVPLAVACEVNGSEFESQDVCGVRSKNSWCRLVVPSALLGAGLPVDGKVILKPLR